MAKTTKTTTTKTPNLSLGGLTFGNEAEKNAFISKNAGNPYVAADIAAANTPAANPVAATNFDSYTQPQSVDDATIAAAEAAKTNTASLTNTPSNKDRESALSMFQSEIDALNKVYADQRAAEITAGRGRLGSSAAIQARRGLLGSDFGASATAGQEAANTEALNAIANKHSAEISRVQGLISQSALDIAKARVEAAQSGAQAKLDELKSRKQRTSDAVSAAVKAYLSSGNDGSQLTEADAQSWVDTFKKQGINVSVNDIINTVKDVKKTIDKDAADLLSTKFDMSKPAEIGGFIWKFDTNSGTWKNTGQSTSKGTSPAGPLNIIDVARYNELYPNAGVTAGDTELTANSKVAQSNSPEAQTRGLIIAAKNNNTDYDTVVTEIDKDTTIADKNLAKKIAGEVYGVQNSQTSPYDIPNQGAILSADTGKNRELNFRESVQIDGLYNTLFNK